MDFLFVVAFLKLELFIFVNLLMKINWTYFVFLLSALVLLTLSIFSYYRFEQQKISSALVNQTYLVKSKLEEAFGTLIDADAGQRGYLLTRDSIFLKQFLSSKSVLLQIAHELDSLVVDPGQKNNLKEFHRLVGLRINGLDGVFDSAQRSNTSQPGTFLIQSKLVSDTVRNHIAYIEKQEDILLSLRINEEQKQEKKTSTFILIFSLFSLAILVYSFFRLKKESKLLSKSEYNAELLEQKVNERTAEIKKINQKLHDQNLELERKNADLASFTFVASHDLKEPLRKIEIFADKIIRTEQQLTEKGKNYFDRIISSASRMKNLIDSVSQFAQTMPFIQISC